MHAWLKPYADDDSKEQAAKTFRYEFDPELLVGYRGTSRASHTHIHTRTHINTDARTHTHTERKRER